MITIPIWLLAIFMLLSIIGVAETTCIIIMLIYIKWILLEDGGDI